jgi:hypothetical protein
MVAAPFAVIVNALIVKVTLPAKSLVMVPTVKVPDVPVKLILLPLVAPIVKLSIDWAGTPVIETSTEGSIITSSAATGTAPSNQLAAVLHVPVAVVGRQVLLAA